MCLVELFAWFRDGVQAELVDNVKHFLDRSFSSLFRIFALCRRIGTFENCPWSAFESMHRLMSCTEILAAFSDHRA